MTRAHLRLFVGTLLATLPLGLGAIACDTPLPGDDACKDVGYAIANKLFECHGDAQAANDAYERFQGAHACKVSDLPTDDEILDGYISEPEHDVVADRYACGAAILRLSCEQATGITGDLDAFLAADPKCGLLFDRTGNGALPTGQGGAAGAGGQGGDVPPSSTFAVDFTWDGRIFVQTCDAQPSPFSFQCTVPSGDATLTVYANVLRFSPRNTLSTEEARPEVDVSFVLQRPDGTISYAPLLDPAPQDFSHVLTDEGSSPAQKSFRWSFAVTHPEGGGVPFLTGQFLIDAKGQLCAGTTVCE